MIKSSYASYSQEEMEELLSNFLISSWSYSKVTTFARNEKAFEMNYIYGERNKSSASTIAGNAYHEALRYFFTKYKEGVNTGLPELEQIAFNYIDEVPAHYWKLQKTTPTVEDCIKKCSTVVSSLLKHFVSEINLYIEDISDVLAVELSLDEFLVINGVEIPLPCHCIIDLIVKTKDGKTVIVDHKSKAVYSNDEDVALTIGIQAITYIKSYENHSGLNVDEVWFIENKYSTNKDKSPQLKKFKVELNSDTLRLYEALLYEPLRRMISAVSDPDYVYLINDSDSYIDKAEVYDFWAKTMISEVEDFNVPDAKRELLSRRLKKIRDASISTINPKIIKEFKQNASAFIQYDLSDSNMTQEEKIEHVLRSFGTIVRVAHTFNGYSSNTFLLEISAGTKVASIHSHKLDIANALDVSTVRISRDLIVHDGKSYLAVEISKKRDRDLIWEQSDLSDHKIPIGKDNYGNIIFWDLNNHSTPHMLVCGATGSGKSVMLRSTIEYAKLAGIENIIILDPKYEFVSYNFDSTVTVLNDIIEIEEKMAEMVEEMNRRVQYGESKFTLIIFDEFADALAQSRIGPELDIKAEVQVGYYAPKKGPLGLMMPAAPKMAVKTVGTLKSLEENLKILLQKGRSSGFRIVAATQRASVKVITGDAKVNFPVQVCFRVPKETDSRVVIDEPGAESLSGMGDGLIKSPEYNDTVRFQAYYKK